VVERLKPRELAALYDLREHTVVVCFVCGGQIPPEDETAVQIVMLADVTADSVVLKCAHPTCMTSAILAMRLPPLSSKMDNVYTPILRSGDTMPAVLLWETVMKLHLSRADVLTDPLREALVRSGFRSATDRLSDLVGPLARRCKMVRSADALEFSAGETRQDFFEVVDAAGQPWLDSASELGRVLVVYGSGFGFERFSLERIDRVLQAGDAVCALVPYEERET
jgi:hypothetical protein